MVGALVWVCALAVSLGSLRQPRLEVEPDEIHSSESRIPPARFHEQVPTAYPTNAADHHPSPAKLLVPVPDLPNREDSAVDAGRGRERVVDETQSVPVRPIGTARAESLLRVDPIAALEIARELPATERRDDFLEQAVMEWGGLDSKSSARWVRQIQSESLRNRLLGAVALGMATDQPGAAARLASEEMQPGSEQDRVTVGIVQRWIQSDPDGAAAWVEQFPQSPLRRVVVETLLSGWLSKDPAGARQWVLRLPEGGLRTHASAVASRWLDKAL